MTTSLPQSPLHAPGAFPLAVPSPGPGPRPHPVTPAVADPRQNHLLGALTRPALEHWLPNLEPVDMPLGMVLWESGRPLKHAYFPTTSIVALMYGLEDGRSSAVSLVGSEGVVGLLMLMGAGSALGRTVVISAGQGFRLRAPALMIDFEGGGAATQLLLRYTQALVTQVAQAAVCNRHHSLERRLCRLLLSTLDRLHGSTQFAMTQELMASLLGVRREGVTEAALNLQRAGLLAYQRGHITVLDRAGLERRTCECHAVVKKEYERLLPPESVS